MNNNLFGENSQNIFAKKCSNNLFVQLDNRFEVELPQNQEEEKEKLEAETTIDNVLEAFEEFLPSIAFVVHNKIRKGKEMYEAKEMELELIR